MSELTELAARYKRNIASRYRALKPDELSEIPPGTMWISPKIDGEMWIAVLENGQASLIPPGSRSPLAASPVLEELAGVAKKVKGRTILAGELFAASKGAKSRPRVFDVGAALGDGGKALERLGFQAFDVLELEGGLAPTAYADRLAAIEKLLEGGKRAVPIKTVKTADKAELKARWAEWGESGKAEGMVVRTEDGRIFKVKPICTIDAVVVGFTTRVDSPEECRSLLLALVRPDGAFQLVSSVGNLGSDSARRTLLESILPLECASNFRHPSGDGALFRWVKPSIVVEVSCTDVQAEDTDGRPLPRWTLEHDGTTWTPLAAMPGATLLHPVLQRVRTDKKANDIDARVAQLGERAMVFDLDRAAEKVELPKSTVVRREVWTKETKGKTAVRKLVVFETGKSQAVAGWPAFVVHFTDYSPDRKTPLERTVKTARTKVESDAIATAMVTENIKKGWEPASPGLASKPAAEKPAEPAPEPAAPAEDAPKKPAKKAAKKAAK